MFFLTGLPASGKSYWARKWAAEASLPFADIDTEIEKAAGTTIQQLFQTEGEAGFRERETAALKRIIAGSNPQTIVATGGGTPAFGENPERMKSAGTVVYLKAPVPLLAQRIFAQKEVRPLFGNCRSVEAAVAVLEALLAGRASFYESAHLILEVKNLSSTTFEKTIQCFTVRPCS